MLGMEMMLSNMIGMKPDELQKAVQGTMAAIHRGVNLLDEINARLIDCQQRLDIMEGNNLNGKQRRIGNESRNNNDHVQL